MELAFEKITLPNGLDVILHREPALPIVSVNVWYHVGSKDEEPGKTGFAHLFEHIMFEGTKHHNESHFVPLQKVGAQLNGSTTIDRTNYWETAPSNYLELALWLEAERMGFLLDALDQRRFDVQRDVVKNERRQSYENRPYGMAFIKLQELGYPAPHPYHWPTIGYHEDLDNASLEDVRAFFQRFYIPNNASLAIAGDFELEQAKELVHRYFADLPPGPPVPRIGRMDSPLGGPVDAALHDRVTLPRVYLTWPSTPRFDRDEAPVSILAAILADGKSSRLHKELVYQRRIAQSVNVWHATAEIAGALHLDITAAPGHTLQEVEDAARDELERIAAQPPSPEEVERVKNHIESQTIRQLANIGGFGGRANRLNTFNVFTGDPARANRDMDRFLGVTPEDVQRAAQRYVGNTQVRLSILPEPAYAATLSSVDRTVQPAPSAKRSFTPPLPQRRQLASGMQVLVVEKPGLPLVAFGLAFQGGGVDDPPHMPGLAAFTTAMLQEGTTTRTSQQIADEFEFMGTQLSTNTGREQTFLATETLAKHWPQALGLLADIVMNPTFPDHELERLRRERLTSLRRLKDDPASTAMRVAPMLFYGPESAYGHSMLGTEESLSAVSRDDMAGFFSRTYGPEQATLIVVGDVTVDRVVALVENHLGGWKVAGAPAPAYADGAGQMPESTTLYLLDKPGAAQSVIRAGHVTVPRSHPDYHAIQVLNYVFGGQFTARLNMNLRQDKGYSYGYNSYVEWHAPSSLLMAGGGVQTEVTKEAVQETLREFADIQGPRPVDEAEFQNARDALLQQFPSGFETPSQVLDQLSRLVLHNLPDDYHRTVVQRIEAVTLEDVRRVARERLASDRLTLLVVGDRARIEPGLQELGLPVVAVDFEGRVVDK